MILQPLPVPTSADELSQSIDDIVGQLPGPARDGTRVLVPGAGAIDRLGLALEPWPESGAWVEGHRLNGLFLHRHWRLVLAAVPAGTAVVANHAGFDRRFGFAGNPELHAGLRVRPLARLPDRDGYPLGVVVEGAERTPATLRAELEAMFGGVEEELAEVESRTIRRMAIARAMTAELLHAAASLGAQAYVTGQLRHPARAAAARWRLHVFAVGHRRSEAWGLAELADRLAERWPGVAIVSRT